MDHRLETIGVLSKNYAAKRLFLNKIPSARYKDIRLNNRFLWKNVHLWFLKSINMLHMSPEEMVSKMLYDFREIVPSHCDIFHFFNCINYSKKKSWVISVETAVPWTQSVARCVEREKPDFSQLKNDLEIKKRIEVLAAPNCLGLLALSECSYNIQLAIVSQFPEYEKQIREKMIILHPSQNLIIHDISEKGLSWKEDENFTFCFIGSNFYRKGGREMIQALSELRQKYSFRLLLVSSLSVDEQRYLLHPNDERDTKIWIDENSDWVEYYPGLPNDRVLDLLKISHVCLLPTWMDTYAYSVLESQACGTPLITTSLRALTETNSSEVGWTIEVPVNRLNHPLNSDSQEIERFSNLLLTGLKKKIEYVLTHREEVKAKSIKCLERIAKKHNPETYQNALKLVYEGRIQDLSI